MDDFEGAHGVNGRYPLLAWWYNDAVETGVEALKVEGYVVCGCGTMMPELSVGGRRRMCDECLGSASERLEAAQFTYEVEGREFSTVARVKRDPTSNVRRRRKRKTAEVRQRDALRNLARKRAIARLIRVYRPTFELLLADEKAKVGLDPKLIRVTPRPVAVSKAILADLAEAADRESRALEAELLRRR